MTELIGGVFCVALFYLWRRSRLRRRLYPYAIEKTLEIEEPVALIGRPDVVWQNGLQHLVVGDYKTRKNPQVYESDIIQLSAYRFLLCRTQKRKVEKYGFIHFADGRRTRVELMSDREIIGLYQRYLAICSGRKKARSCENENYCAYCAYREDC